jgi:uncharacterized membrane protein YbhN (UPF0104 family)
VGARQGAIMLFKFVAAGVLVWWLWKSGRLDFSRLARVRIGFAFFGVIGFQAAMLGCVAARWHSLTRAFGLNLPARQTFRVSCIGNFAAVWTPAGLGLDGVRLVFLRRLAPRHLGAAAASTLWDRALGVWALACLSFPACALLLLDDSLAPVTGLRRALWLLLVACGVLALAPLFLQTRAPEVMARRWPALRQLSGANFAYQGAWKSALLFAFMTHSCNFLSLWCALRALDIVAAPAPALLVAPLVVLSSLLPLTPMGLGVTDAAASTLLHAVGVSGGAEATMLGRATFVLLSAACGLAWLWPAPPLLPSSNDHEISHPEAD